MCDAPAVVAGRHTVVEAVSAQNRLEPLRTGSAARCP